MVLSLPPFHPLTLTRMLNAYRKAHSSLANEMNTRSSFVIFHSAPAYFYGSVFCSELLEEATSNGSSGSNFGGGVQASTVRHEPLSMVNSSAKNERVNERQLSTFSVLLKELELIALLFQFELWLM